jgi:hypothetical protein
VAIERAKQDSKKYEESKDFFHHIMTARDPDTGKGLSEDQVIAESALLIIAGEPSMFSPCPTTS